MLLFSFHFCLITELDGQQIFGEELQKTYESPHPYNNIDGHKESWKQQIRLENRNSIYIALHFDKFQLAKGDELLVRSSNGEIAWKYDHHYNQKESFWTIPISGVELTLELVSNSTKNSYGYHIDKLARGFNANELAERNSSATICGVLDDSEEAKCFQSTESTVYNKSRAVARIWRGPTLTHCTGWLFGSEDHMLTAGHCNLTAALNDNVQILIEMMAEGGTCSDNCQSAGICLGDFIADQVTVVKEVDNAGLDYSLFHLPNGVPNGYGYLSANMDGPILQERIYIPQHPNGFGKRIAVLSDAPQDIYGFPQISEFDGIKVKYYADTSPKSSGSPVISYEDHVVVALHTGGKCPTESNTGLDITKVIEDLDFIPKDAVWERPCLKGPNNTEITTAETWNLPKFVRWDIFIKNPGQLTIKSNVYFTPGSNIYVERGAKLIIDGGVVSSCDEEKWNGIIVEGALIKANLNGQLEDPDDPTDITYAGTVIVKNGGTIDNAINGISSFNRHKPYVQWYQFHGGLIYCNNAFFTNCNRAVEITPFGNSKNPDNSLFHNTTFLDLKEGVTNWASDGVTFTQCHFENIEKSAAGGYNAAINVYDGNTFVNVGTGLSFTGTKMNEISPQVGLEGTDPNLFVSGDVGVWLSSVNNIKQTIITNNKFDFSKGIYIEGMNFIRCDHNDFSGSEIGILTFDSKNVVEIQNNEYLNNETPIPCIYDNSFLTFSDNCMDNSTYEDVWIYGDASAQGLVDLDQGNAVLAAGNCFTKTLIPEIFTDGNTLLFEYFVDEDFPTSHCNYPETEGNYIINQAFSTNTEDCGSEGGVPPPTSVDCGPSRNIQTLQSEIQLLDTDIAGLKNNGGSIFEINSKERCLDLSLRTLAELFVASEDYLSSNIYFSARSEFQMRIIPLSNKNQNDEYVEARTYLNNLVTSNQIEIDYKSTLNIYLDFLETENYILSAADQLFLETSGVIPGPLNGYLRSIYYQITGNRIELNLPTRNQAKKFHQENQLIKGVSIFPNPNKSHILNVKGLNGNCTFELFDSTGRMIQRREISHSMEYLKLNTELQGVYIISLRNSQDIVFQDKLLIL